MSRRQDKKSKASKSNAIGRPLLSGSQLEADPKLIERISNMIRIGSYIEVAAAVNGIGYSTLREWVTKGKEHPESLYGEFARALQKALSDAEIRDLASVDVHATGREAVYEREPIMEVVLENGIPLHDDDGRPLMRVAKDAAGNVLTAVVRDSKGDPVLKRAEIKPTWQAAAWKLERRNPNKWGRFDKPDHDRALFADELPKDVGPQKQDISEDQYRKKMIETREVLRNMEDLEDDPFGRNF